MAANLDIQDFPQDFFWGVATSSYQIEGASTADGKGRSIWDTFCDEPGRIVDGSSGRDAVRHFDLWQEDITLMASLGVTAYRFSVSWPRVMPDGLQLNERGLDFYDRLVDGLLHAGIQPFLTLYHWDLPQVLEDRGGWLDRGTAEAFGAYAMAVADRLGDRVKHWTTLNEPYVSSTFGYVTGEHAPGKQLGRAAGFDAAHHLLLGHARGVEALRTATADLAIGITLNFTPVTAASVAPADRYRAATSDSIENRWFLEPLCGLPYPGNAAEEGWRGSVVADGDMAAIAGTIDFLGVNYYTRQFVGKDGVLPASEPTTTMGWEIHPGSLTRVLERIHATAQLPSYFITENGAAMRDLVIEEGHILDGDRIEYVKEHLGAVADAIAGGVPVRGYFLWTLFDNFEWAHGFTQKFGVVAIEPETYRRVPKKSAYWYRDLITRV